MWSSIVQFIAKEGIGCISWLREPAIIRATFNHPFFDFLSETPNVNIIYDGCHNNTKVLNKTSIKDHKAVKIF